MATKQINTIADMPQDYTLVTDSRIVAKILENHGLLVYLDDYQGLFISPDDDTIYAFNGVVPALDKHATLLVKSARAVRSVDCIEFEQQDQYPFPLIYSEYEYHHCIKFVRVSYQDKFMMRHQYHLHVLCGWYYWSECPGCLPDSEACFGPFKSLALARADAYPDWDQIG